jgi:hypothetical protein
MAESSCLMPVSSSRDDLQKAVHRSQGTSTVLGGHDLKSELRSLPAKPIFGAPPGILFRPVKDTLVVGLLCAQEVVNDSGQFVGRGCDRLGPAELPDAPEEHAEVVFSVMQ